MHCKAAARLMLWIACSFLLLAEAALLLSLSLLCFQFYLLFLPGFPVIFTHYSYFIPMPSPIIPVILFKFLLCQWQGYLVADKWVYPVWLKLILATWNASWFFLRSYSIMLLHIHHQLMFGNDYFNTFSYFSYQ